VPAPYELEALGAYGIVESDIVYIDRPARVERLVTDSHVLHNGTLSSEFHRDADGLKALCPPTDVRGGPCARIGSN
jgi:hypothetical protein